jgi:hypothetical protein
MSPGRASEEALPMTWTEDLDRHLARLLAGGDAGLDGGAELEVHHPDGTLAFLAPLARHHRVDPDASVEARTCIWIRPIVGGYTPDPRRPGDPIYAFDLAQARRRNLTFTHARRDGDALVFDLDSGQRAQVRPARSDLLTELHRWDTWYYLHLTPTDQATLDAIHLDAG